MKKVYACIDGLSHTNAVVDGAVWSARRLGAPLAFLHVLERESGPVRAHDHSGAIGLGAQESLLHELSELDARRGKIAQDAGRNVLRAARDRASAAGVLEQDARLRHGNLIEEVLEVEVDARLFVLGEHHRHSGHSRLAADHPAEQIIRTLHCPVLVVSGDTFTALAHVAIAFDGSVTARKAVTAVARSPLLAGLPILVAMAVTDSETARAQLEDARSVLVSAGFEVTVTLVAGPPEKALPQLINEQGIDLLVMGAYGHSRVRQLIVGSTTTALLRTSAVSVLVLR